MLSTGALEVANPRRRASVEVGLMRNRRLANGPTNLRVGGGRSLGVTLVHKGARGAARAAVEVFAATPAAEVDVPIVQLKQDVAHGWARSNPHVATAWAAWVIAPWASTARCNAVPRTASHRRVRLLPLRCGLQCPLHARWTPRCGDEVQ